MIRIRSLVLLLAVLCPGCLYTDVQTVLDEDLYETVLGSKVGESSSHSVLWLFAWGDSGTRAAARDGGLSVIYHADQKFFTVLWGLYFRQTTVLYGD